MIKGSEVINPEKKELASSSSINSPMDSPLLQSPTKKKKQKGKSVLLEDRETQEDKDARNLDKSQIARLQHKFMILIMALLEMRDLKDSEIIMKRIVRSLPKELLEHKLTHIYLQYRSLYDKKYIIEAFGHFFFFFIILFIGF